MSHPNFATIARAASSYLAAIDDAGPGCAIAVWHDGEIIWQSAAGMANLEHEVPLTTQSVFHVASVSKQITAMCAAHLIRDGKVGLTDDVRTIIPELPNDGEPIRVHHLLHHTSGLRDDLWVQDFAGWRDDAWVSATDALDLIVRQRGLSFPTGERFFYTNAGYSLLAVMIERITAQPLHEYAAQHLFAPLGMADTRFAATAGEIVPNRAVGYSRTEEGRWRTLSPDVGLNGAIGLLTTVEDFGRWFAYLQQQLTDKSVIADLIRSTGMLNSGEAVSYSLGFFTGEHGGQPVLRHGGSHGGYRSHMMYLPESAVGIACFANSGDANPGGVCDAIADAILDVRQNSAVSTDIAQPLRSELPLQPGVYFEEEWGAWLHVREQQGSLHLIDVAARSLHTNDRGGYVASGLGMGAAIYLPDASAPDTLQVIVGGSDEPDIFRRVAFAPMLPADLDAFAGAYWSDELAALYELTADHDSGGLLLRRRGHEPTTLLPVGNDTFSVGFFSQQISLAFSRDADATVRGCGLSSLRTRNIQFTRTPFSK